MLSQPLSLHFFPSSSFWWDEEFPLAATGIWESKSLWSFHHSSKAHLRVCLWRPHWCPFWKCFTSCPNFPNFLDPLFHWSYTQCTFLTFNHPKNWTSNRKMNIFPPSRRQTRLFFSLEQQTGIPHPSILVVVFLHIFSLLLCLPTHVQNHHWEPCLGVGVGTATVHGSVHQHSQTLPWHIHVGKNQEFDSSLSSDAKIRGVCIDIPRARLGVRCGGDQVLEFLLLFLKFIKFPAQSWTKEVLPHVPKPPPTT